MYYKRVISFLLTITILLGLCVGCKKKKDRWKRYNLENYDYTDIHELEKDMRKSVEERGEPFGPVPEYEGLTICIEISSSDGFEFGKFSDVVISEDMNFSVGLINNDVIKTEQSIEVYEKPITDHCIVEGKIIRASHNAAGLITIEVKPDSVQE